MHRGVGCWQGEESLHQTFCWVLLQVIWSLRAAPPIITTISIDSTVGSIMQYFAGLGLVELTSSGWSV